MQRAKRVTGLPADVVLYRLRHAFAVHGVRMGVHLKVLAETMGHVDTRMIDLWYCNIRGDVPLLLEAVRKMFGPSEKGGAPNS